MSAHKASYLLFRGPVDDGQVIGHQCNNEWCVNPHHLEAESQSQNMIYCVKAGRHGSQKRQKLATEIKSAVKDTIWEMFPDCGLLTLDIEVNWAEVEELEF